MSIYLYTAYGTAAFSCFAFDYNEVKFVGGTVLTGHSNFCRLTTGECVVYVCIDGGVLRGLTNTRICFLFIFLLKDIGADACVCNISRFGINSSPSKLAAVLVITSLRTAMRSTV